MNPSARQAKKNWDQNATDEERALLRKHLIDGAWRGGFVGGATTLGSFLLLKRWLPIGKVKLALCCTTFGVFTGYLAFSTVLPKFLEDSVQIKDAPISQQTRAILYKPKSEKLPSTPFVPNNVHDYPDYDPSKSAQSSSKVGSEIK